MEERKLEIKKDTGNALVFHALNEPLFPGNIALENDEILMNKNDTLETTKILQKTILNLYGKYLSSDGKHVNYNGILSSNEFKKYVNLTYKLRNINLSLLNKMELKACFINIYNALTIHGTIIYGPPYNFINKPDIYPQGLSTFFTNVSYNIGGYTFSLDNIEHGILRCNEPKRKQFNDNDKRIQFILDPPIDPRIHASLVCGAKSCPPIRVFDVNNLNKGLDLAIKTFCDNEIEIKSDNSNSFGKKVFMNKILYWYRYDFGINYSKQILKMSEYCNDIKKALLTDISAVINDDNVSDYIVFKEYDWNSNN